MNLSAGGQSVEHAWESLSDGVEVAEGGVLSRLLWEGEALVFNCRPQGSDESWIMSWRYELLEEASASEQLNRYVVAAGIRTTFGSSSGGERDATG